MFPAGIFKAPSSLFCPPLWKTDWQLVMGRALVLGTSRNPCRRCPEPWRMKCGQSQHKVGDQMSPDYVPLKSKQSPTFRIISLRLPGWKLEPIQNLTTAGLPRLGFMCLVENVTCVLLIGFCEAIKQYSEDPKHTALCWNLKRAIYHRNHQRLITGLGRPRGRCFSSYLCHPCWPWSCILVPYWCSLLLHDNTPLLLGDRAHPSKINSLIKLSFQGDQ